MPEVRFEVHWPDGDKVTYYSPSTVIHQHLEAHSRYPLQEFLTRVDTALNEASERVRERFGFYCSSAASEQGKIREKAEALKAQNLEGEVLVYSFLK